MIENVMTKRRIFEIYLNIIEWGNGVFGAEAAARYYYDTSAANLDAGAGGTAGRDGAQAALLRPGPLDAAAGAAHRHHPGAHVPGSGSLKLLRGSIPQSQRKRRQKQTNGGTGVLTSRAYDGGSQHCTSNTTLRFPFAFSRASACNEYVVLAVADR